VFVAGDIYGSVTFGSGDPAQTTLSSTQMGSDVVGGAASNTEDAFVAHYAADGTLAWAAFAARGAGSESAGEIAVDVPGAAVLVTGQYGDENGFVSTTYFGAGDAGAAGMVTDNQSGQMYLVRLNAADGTLVWVQRTQGGDSRAFGHVVGTDGDGGPLVAGVWGSCVYCISGETSEAFGYGQPRATTLHVPNPNPSYDLFVARYGADGNLAWARAVMGPSSYGNWVGGIAPAPSGASMFVGLFSTQATFGPGEPGAITLTSTGNQQRLFVAGYLP
jgi:hypothetical protein